MDKCPECGKVLALVGRVHNCRPPLEAVEVKMRPKKKLPEEEDFAIAQSRRAEPEGATLHQLEKQYGLACPICEARRKARTLAQKKWRQKRRADGR